MPVVLVFSEDQSVRDQVRLALGRSPAPGVDDITYLMADTGAEVVKAVDERLVDLLVLDGEAWPTGGLGISRELKSSHPACPPVIALLARRDDRWLATWSMADATLMHPVDPVELTTTAVALLTGAAATTADPTAGSRPAAADKEHP